MDYSRVYREFVADRRTKERALIASGEYNERHHILPRSLGGGDGPENLLCLSAEDHYFAHELLAKIYGGKMWNCLILMAERKVPFSKRRRALYATARRKLAISFTNDNPMKDEVVKSRLWGNPAFVEKQRAAVSFATSQKDHPARQALREKWRDGDWRNKKIAEAKLLPFNEAYMKSQERSKSFVSDSVAERHPDDKRIQTLRRMRDVPCAVINVATGIVYPNINRAVASGAYVCSKTYLSVKARGRLRSSWAAGDKNATIKDCAGNVWRLHEA